MATKPAAERINELINASRLRQAYHDGSQDGALSVLAPALGVDGAQMHQLMGHRFRVSIDWIDPIDDKDMAILHKMVERSRQRAHERQAG